MSGAVAAQRSSRAALLAAAERWLVVLVSAHSVVIGLMLLAAPAWSVRFAGWHGAEPLFFLRQAGVFHFVVALGYLLEYFRTRTVTLLVCTKTMAASFLILATVFGEVAWSVPFCGAADGLMGLAVLVAHRAASRAR